ncbi:MAG: transglutaminase-like domain-containing protein [Candidatus Acidiferrales bacterium]
MRKKTTGSWKDIGLWYNGLTASSRTPTPAIQQKVAQLTAGMSDPLEKMKALAAFVQRDIRYAAIEIGIGGYRPHAAADIFTNAYGDCKDKATLLSTMLKEIGIDSYYVLIDTDRGVVQPNFPSTNFDHAILAIQVPDAVPGATLYAITKDPKLGRLLFFDPTNPYVPFGYVPAYLQDTYALLATPDGGELVSVPLLPASTNRLIRTAQLELSSTGNLSGEVRELRWGAPATSSRDQLLTAEPAKRGKVFEDFLGNSLTAFTLMGASVGNLEQYDQSLTLDYKFFARGYAKSAGDLLVVRPRVLGQKGSDILSGKPRKYSIEFPDATRQDDDFEITLPAGYVVDELPQPVKAECPYGSYRSRVEISGNTLTYKRMYQINDIIVPTEKLGEVRGFFQQIASDERSSAILRKTSP